MSASVPQPLPTTSLIVTASEQAEPRLPEMALPICRLIVLVPDIDLDENRLARYIWALALSRYLEVMFLGTFDNPEAEFRIRRRLTLMAAIVQDDQLKVETRLYPVGQWVKAVKAVWKPGDLVICQSGQTETVGWLFRLPLAPRLKFPVVELADFTWPADSAWPQTLWRWASNLALIITLVGCTYLQIKVQQVVSEEWVRTVVLCLTVALEFGMIWLNHWLSN